MATEIDPDDFVDEIDNPYLPFEPGSISVYVSEGGDETTVGLVRVTHQTKEILRVDCTIVHDTEWVDGELAERTADWYAQDEDGNVWYFGEFSMAFEDGAFDSLEGSWIAGRNDAEPGIVMEAHPEVGDTYAQENAPGIAEDMATVLSLHAEVEIPYGEFENALKTKEFTPLEPDVLESKYYVKGIGNVLAVDEVTGEREELVYFKDGDDRDGCDDDWGGCDWDRQDAAASDALAGWGLQGAEAAQWDFA
jgi:hypothetical protein